MYTNSHAVTPEKFTTVYKKPNYLVPITTDLLQVCTAESEMERFQV